MNLESLTVNWSGKLLHVEDVNMMWNCNAFKMLVIFIGLAIKESPLSFHCCYFQSFDKTL
jgi:hypothetical protein